jgi:hypothetical protein
MQIEREKQDMLSIQKKVELTNIENAIELKRYEMALKRAEDLADSYLKAKRMRVWYLGTR